MAGYVDDRWREPGRDGRGKRWRGRVTTPGGRTLSKSFDREKEAKDWVAEQRTDLKRGQWTDPRSGKITLREYAEQWRQGYHPDTSRAEHIGHHLSKHILPALGDMAMADLAARPSAVRQWLARLPLARSSARLVFVTLSAIMASAVDDGVITRNPCQAKTVRRPAPDRREVEPWTAAQIRAIRSGMPARYRAILDAAYGLGLRQGECFALAPDSVDWLRRQVRVTRQVKRINGRLWFGLPKEDRTRTVPLPQATSLALAAHIEQFPPVEVTLPWCEPGSPRHGHLVTVPLIFTSRALTVVKASSFGDFWRTARDAAGIADGGIHMARHSYASECLAGGVSIKELSRHLGHGDPAVTLRIYTHLTPDADEKARQVMDKVLSADGDQAAGSHSPDHSPAAGNPL